MTSEWNDGYDNGVRDGRKSASEEILEYFKHQVPVCSSCGHKWCMWEERFFMKAEKQFGVGGVERGEAPSGTSPEKDERLGKCPTSIGSADVTGHSASTKSPSERLDAEHEYGVCEHVSCNRLAEIELCEEHLEDIENKLNAEWKKAVEKALPCLRPSNCEGECEYCENREKIFKEMGGIGGIAPD